MSDRTATVNDRALTLDRGLRVLELLARSEADMSVAAISSELRLHRQAVYRILGTLQQHGLAVKAGAAGFRLGFAAVILAGSWIPRLETLARPLMRRLADNSAATAFLTVGEGEQAVAILVVEPTHTDLHVAYRPGARHALNRGAGGIAILAGRSFVPGEPTNVTAARERGVAVTRGQVTPGALGVAAPLSLWPHPTGSASIGVIALADGANVEMMMAQVVAAARDVDSALGAT